jgi:hypothetical protein
MTDALWELVRQRADNRCEYCHLHQEHDSFYTFPVDHVIARQHRGETTADNLALSCFRCNSYKGPNIASIDAVSGELVPLFNPRSDAWSEHFTWRGSMLVSQTTIGRATISLLQINHPQHVLLREELIAEGVFDG